MIHDAKSFAAAPPGPSRIRLAELLSAFSYALDITEGQPEGHCTRACWIGVEIGKRLGLAETDSRDLFYAVLLKDLGCSSNAARICDLYGTDDRAFKRDFKLVGTSLSDVVAFVIARTSAGAPLKRRAKAVTNILVNGPKIARELIQTRCERGADIARRLRFSPGVADAIYSLDEHWDGTGKPDGLKGEAIPLLSRIALLAQVAEVFHAHAGPEAATAEVKRRSGSWFDPDLADIFGSLSADPSFWEVLASPDLERRLLESAAAQCQITVDEDFLDDIAAAFGEVVDAKSPFTSGHSTRVASYTDRIAEIMDYAPDRRRWLRRGAFLHDIGKLGVSNSILDKPGKLDAAEWDVMRDHALHTGSILGRISAFQDLAPLAAAHHERIDGKGYPLGLKDIDIGLETRIITICDFFDALTADRPYRGAMPVGEALAVIGASVGEAIDPHCYQALQEMVRQDG